MPHTPLEDGPPWYGTPDRKARPEFAEPPAEMLPGALYVDLYRGDGIDQDGDEGPVAFMAHWLDEAPTWPGRPLHRGQVFSTYLSDWVNRHLGESTRVFMIRTGEEVTEAMCLPRYAGKMHVR